MILFVKYYLMRLKSSFEITWFPLFQNINRNFFHLKYEQQVYITWDKIPEHEGSISPFSFYVQLPDY